MSTLKRLVFLDNVSGLALSSSPRPKILTESLDLSFNDLVASIPSELGAASSLGE